jgi:hypothetical protein
MTAVGATARRTSASPSLCARVFADEKHERNPLAEFDDLHPLDEDEKVFAGWRLASATV